MKRFSCIALIVAFLGIFVIAILFDTLGYVKDFEATKDSESAKKIEIVEEFEIVEDFETIEESDFVEEFEENDTTEPIDESNFVIPEEKYFNGLLVEDVKILQRNLNEFGANIEVDGKYCEATDAAVRVYQREHGLKPDGIVGKDTIDSLKIFLSEPDVSYCFPLLAGEGTDWRVTVNLGARNLRVYHWENDEWVLEMDESCVIGANNTTPKGRFSIQEKHAGFWKNEMFWAYMTVFSGEFGFHSVPYVGDQCKDSRLGIAASHGCIRLARDKAKWLQDNVPVGSDVYIF